jgi:hypothetical protein
MRSLTASDLLAIWECGQDKKLIETGLILLASSYPEKTQDELARLPVGRRDALLLDMREDIFGPILSGLATCPHCGQSLEISFNTDDIWAVPETEPEQELFVEKDEYKLHLRLPNSLDMMDIADQDLTEATQALIRRCLLGIIHRDNEVSVEILPEAILEAASERMSKADSQADVELALSCPQCGNKWQMPFDILSFFWKEIDSWAYRILQDVHSLASEYGWSEAEILAMSNRKRQSYLDLVGR